MVVPSNDSDFSISDSFGATVACGFLAIAGIVAVGAGNLLREWFLEACGCCGLGGLIKPSTLPRLTFLLSRSSLFSSSIKVLPSILPYVF
jgi:hypothetical protein